MVIERSVLVKQILFRKKPALFTLHEIPDARRLSKARCLSLWVKFTLGLPLNVGEQHRF